MRNSKKLSLELAERLDFYSDEITIAFDATFTMERIIISAKEDSISCCNNIALFAMYHNLVMSARINDNNKLLITLI